MLAGVAGVKPASTKMEKPGRAERENLRSSALCPRGSIPSPLPRSLACHVLCLFGPYSCVKSSIQDNANRMSSSTSTFIERLLQCYHCLLLARMSEQLLSYSVPAAEDQHCWGHHLRSNQYLFIPILGGSVMSTNPEATVFVTNCYCELTAKMKGLEAQCL